MTLALDQFSYSLSHDTFINTLARQPKLLVIQDLDGVCMDLVRNPLVRSLAPNYIHACKTLSGEFYVLTNGEHIGSRGINPIVDKAFGGELNNYAKQQGLYLPGLAAGGVQFQDCYGQISHPGVTPAEIAFLKTVPTIIAQRLKAALAQAPFNLKPASIDQLLAVIVLDNALSPTLNIGSLFEFFAGTASLYVQAQTLAHTIMDELQALAREQGLAESFFIHLAPNYGASKGVERIKPATSTDMGTTDFQFMLRGAIKEVGVLVLLNHYYFTQTGCYPLGEDFNARTAPHTADALLDLAEQVFEPALMPCLIGVGDTVTSSAEPNNTYNRGGSDRGFLALVQALGQRLCSHTATVFVDSSGGELNRPGVQPKPNPDASQIPVSALQGISDTSDELRFNTVFPGGYQQYTEFFIRLANTRRAHINNRA